MQVNTLVNARNQLGESPLWHPQEQVLYWVDAIKPALHCFDPQTNQHHHFPMPALIGSIGWRAEGGLIAAIGEGIAFIDTNTGEVSLTHSILSQRPGFHLNDGKCDRQGNFWVGEVCAQPTHANGQLYCVQANGDIKIMEHHIKLSNGLGFSPDNQFFYFTDTLAHTIYRYQFEPQTLAITQRESFIVNDNPLYHLDGLTIDSEGCLWVALWDSYQCRRYAPSGELLTTVDLPIQRPTSCTLGGKTMQTLFITSASQDVGEQSPLEDCNAGHVFSLAVDVPGLLEPAFSG